MQISGRPTSGASPSPARMAKVVRFLPVDPSPESRLLTNSLAHAADWFLAFHTAGTELGSLA
ncbi:hypothetical protein ACTMSZ_12290 [Micromonospora palomenae]